MVLVTGSAGLVGKELISQLLAKGKRVRAIYNINMPVAEGVEQWQCDILDVIKLEEAMQGIEEVYHCAGLVSFNRKDEKLLYKINVEGTANVVNTALDAGVKKMVHVSSVAALGKLQEDIPVTEKMQWTAETSTSKYSESKYLGEMEVWRGIAEGLNAVIVNPSIILGAGNWEDGSTGIFRSAYNEFPWYTEGVKGFVDVRDVAAIMIMLMESEVSGERFIVSAENVMFKDVFSKIAGCFNKKPPSKKASSLVASLAWRMQVLKERLGGGKALLTRETAGAAFARNYYNNEKLLHSFPSFAYRPLDNTITDTCQALQQKLNNQ